MHNSNKHLLPNTSSWVVINSDTMHGKCRILRFKITVLQVMEPCNLIGVLRFQSRHTASTFSWPVKIPSKLLQIIHNHVLDYTVSKPRLHYESSLPWAPPILYQRILTTEVWMEMSLWKNWITEEQSVVCTHGILTLCTFPTNCIHTVFHVLPVK